MRRSVAMANKKVAPSAKMKKFDGLVASDYQVERFKKAYQADLGSNPLGISFSAWVRGVLLVRAEQLLGKDEGAPPPARVGRPPTKGR